MSTGPDSTAQRDSADRSDGIIDDDTLRQDVDSLAQTRELSRRHGQPSSTVPGYQIVRCLGEGAFGSVWLARELKTKKQVAIKFYNHSSGLDWSLLNREVEKLAVLYTSRYIVRLIDVGWDADPPYYVMEYLENGSLASFLSGGSLPPHEAVRIAKSVLRALVHAHGSGILHCDLKPANVLLDASNEPRLCDFGQSRLSDEQDPALGTLFYMAPEQADMKSVPDARWDVYALGALLFQLLVGHPPYRSEESERLIRSADTLQDRLGVYRRVVHQSLRPNEHRKVPGVDRRLADIVDRCLQPDPELRSPNAQAVLDMLTTRDRQRARRPLIALGLIGPVLLLLALLPIARTAMHDAVQTAHATLIDRALESDAHSVTILAHSLERELKDRQIELAEIADNLELRVALEDARGSLWTDRTNLNIILDDAYATTTEKGIQLGRTPEISWFLCDENGYQRWRNRISSKTINQRWAHRDYFHGRNIAYSRGNEPDDIEPLREPHVSLAYLGTSEEKYKVAISVPVWDEKRENVIGVLARTSELGRLLADFEEQMNQPGRASMNRFIGLVDRRDGKLLDHPWIRQKRRADQPDRIETFAKLILDTNLIRKLKQLGKESSNATSSTYNDREANYTDPVGRVDAENYGQQWLAAFSPVRGTSWVAIVQEPKKRALQPVVKLESELRWYFWLGLSICCGLLAASWFFALRDMNDHNSAKAARS